MAKQKIKKNKIGFSVNTLKGDLNLEDPKRTEDLKVDHKVICEKVDLLDKKLERRYENVILDVLSRMRNVELYMQHQSEFLTEIKRQFDGTEYKLRESRRDSYEDQYNLWNDQINEAGF